MQRVTPGIGDAFGLVEGALRETFLLFLFRGLGEGAPGIEVTCLSVNRWDCTYRIRQRQPLKTGQCPVSSQDTSSQRSGARWSYRRRTTWPAFERDGRRCGSGVSCRQRRPWSQPSQGPQSKAHVNCNGQQILGPGLRCSRPR